MLNVRHLQPDYAIVTDCVAKWRLISVANEIICSMKCEYLYLEALFPANATSARQENVAFCDLGELALVRARIGSSHLVAVDAGVSLGYPGTPPLKIPTFLFFSYTGWRQCRMLQTAIDGDRSSIVATCNLQRCLVLRTGMVWDGIGIGWNGLGCYKTEWAAAAA